MIEATVRFFFQRPGGLVRTGRTERLSTSGAAGESRRAYPLSYVIERPRGKLGGNAEFIRPKILSGQSEKRGCMGFFFFIP